MSKMGISTLQSYCGAQIFEAIGLDAGIRRSLLHVDGLADRRRRHRRHRRGSARSGTSARSRSRSGAPADLDTGGEYQWRRDGEHHLFNPETVFKLQHATRIGSVPASTASTRKLVERSEPQARHAARTARFQAGGARCRSTRSSRSSRSSSGSPPARCRTGRSARKRTRRSRSR